jgi:hypothetical protein
MSVAWEYKFLTHEIRGIVNSHVDEERLNELNALGAQGWELVTVIHPTEREGILWRITYVFKRLLHPA